MPQQPNRPSSKPQPNTTAAPAGQPRPAEHERGEYTGPERRKSVVDRRTEYTGLERRRGPGRRRTEFSKAAEEGEMTSEQFLFVKAIDAYKRVNQRPYPSWTEVLEVMRKLGYRKTCTSSLQLDGVEDWTEAPDAPAFRQPPTQQEAA